MDNQQIKNMTLDAEFINRLSTSVTKAAKAIVGENPSPITNSSYIRKRHDLAYEILNNVSGYTTIFGLPVASESSVEGAITESGGVYTYPGNIDTLLDNATVAVFNGVAGVSYQDSLT